jgi:hypothetical protein
LRLTAMNFTYFIFAAGQTKTIRTGNSHQSRENLTYNQLNVLLWVYSFYKGGGGRFERGLFLQKP